jgi:excinuclease ABC subunit A
MSHKKPVPLIRLRGVRHNNLKDFDLDLPLNRLIVVTGVSGSGKSSLAFDTLFAEGQRRYIETFSPYARQFFDRMDKPQVDSIEGIPPAIAIEQRNTVRTTRSTVGTMTEICDYMKALWLHIAELHCGRCGQIVRKDSPQQIWEAILCNAKQHRAICAQNEVLLAHEPDTACVTNPLPRSEVLVSFDLPLSDRLSLDESLDLISRQGYQWLLLGGDIVRIDEAAARLQGSRPGTLTVVQDRLRLVLANRARFVEACEQAFHFGKGRLAIHPIYASAVIRSPRLGEPNMFSSHLHCARCDLEYREPTPSLFSFNHPVGACPTCRGFGRIITIDYALAIPDRSKSLADGAIRPWQSGVSAECQEDLLRFCKQRGVPTDVAFERLPKQWQDWVINGEPDYGKDRMHEWPHAWYGVKGYFHWLESKAYKMHVRVLLSRYRAYQTCRDCKGQRFRPESLLFRVHVPAGQGSGRVLESCPAAGFGESRAGMEGMTLADFYHLPICDALRFIEGLAASHCEQASDPLGLLLGEIRSRLSYLVEVGLGYLTLDRPTRTLSGGETERVSLTTCLGTRLVNTLFVLDEPSVGLHPRDTERLVAVLQRLRQAGNTVVVVEHEPSVMRAADQIVDLGPGHGETGGHVVFQGLFDDLLKCPRSLTGQYLSGQKRIELPQRRPIQRESERAKAVSVRACDVADGTGDGRPQVICEAASRPVSYVSATPPGSDARDVCPWLTLGHVTRHNLRDLTVRIPLQRFVCVTGVSGSGKTTLAREVLLPALRARLEGSPSPGNADRDDPDVGCDHSTWLDGWQHLGRVVLVDQSPLGRTPRSNPAVYIGAFDHLRQLFASSEAARQRGLGASAFSFNSPQGQCERCHGAGFERIEMQFLSDVFICCPDCNGRRYRAHILEVRVAGGVGMRVDAKRRSLPISSSIISSASERARGLSIADLLDATVDEAILFLTSLVGSRPAQRAVERLRALQEVGLGYLRLGQPVNTLSGGESQRLKLVSYLAEFTQAEAGHAKPTLFVFDEPTTGLHFDDIRVLLRVFQRLVGAGHSILVIEHNLEVIKSADWVIDLGPEAGDGGGQIVAEGTPEEVAACEASHTGRALRAVLLAGRVLR